MFPLDLGRTAKADAGERGGTYRVVYSITNGRPQLIQLGEHDFVIRQHRPNPDGGLVSGVAAGLDVPAADWRRKFGKLVKPVFDGFAGDRGDICHALHLCRVAVRCERISPCSNLSADSSIPRSCCPVVALHRPGARGTPEPDRSFPQRGNSRHETAVFFTDSVTTENSPTDRYAKSKCH